MAELNLPLALIFCAIFIYFYGQVQEVPEGLPSIMTANFRNGESKTYRVTADKGSFFINGLHKPNLVVNRGQTYFFNLNTPSTRNHPFYLSTENDKGGLGKYHGELTNSSGVVGSRTNSGQLIWEVPTNFPYKDVFYHCGQHQNMGARITVR